MLKRLQLLAFLVLFAAPVQARPESTWILAKSEHFELYSQAGAESARPALTWFESLHAFFAQRSGSKLEGRPPIRVIAFRSRNDYEEYRLRPNSAAYYVGVNDRDYIVLPTSNPTAFPLAAHEFAHLATHASGIQLPPWLNEGLAELYSTLQITEAQSLVGADQQAHIQFLRRQTWMPLPQLLGLTSGAQTTLFYAQSWALTEMLVLSPAYRAGFEELRTALASGVPSARALSQVYARSITAIETDLQTWVNTVRPATVKLPGVSVSDVKVEISPVSNVESQCLIAELLFAIGEVDRAGAMYRTVLAENPQSAVSYAGLGAIALRKGDSQAARGMWKKALELGLADATLCYHYAVLASDAGLSADEIRPALQRALALKPDNDDARYSLAMLESNAGHFEAALEQWHAMRNVRPTRAFSYWTAVANAYNELGRRVEAQSAAGQALTYARTSDEITHARQLTYLAQTDLTVQFASDSNGQTHMITTRMPHGATNFNPFIEPGDNARRVEGKLAAIDCNGQSLQISVVTATDRLKLTIRDPSRVQMRNAPAEFTCGPQPVTPVVVEYSASGLVRGMEFTAPSNSK